MNSLTEGFMIAWDFPSPTARVEVGPWPDTFGWSKGYSLTAGHCHVFFQELSEKEQAQSLLNLAAQMMFGGIKPNVILEEFSKIEIWREMGVLLPARYAQRAFVSGQIKFNPHSL